MLAYPAGALSDRIDPKSVLLAGIAVLVAADLWLAQATALWAVFAGVALWGAHMALTQGIFARMIADAAPEATARDQLRRLLLRQRRLRPARQPRRGLAVGPRRPGRDLHRRRRRRGAGRRDGLAACRPDR